MIYKKKLEINSKKMTALTLLLIMTFLTSCKTPITNSCQIPLQRLTIIQVDCKDKTYGDCIIEYDSALKQSNKDKQIIIESIKEIK